MPAGEGPWDLGYQRKKAGQGKMKGAPTVRASSRVRGSCRAFLHTGPAAGRGIRWSEAAASAHAEDILGRVSAAMRQSETSWAFRAPRRRRRRLHVVSRAIKINERHEPGRKAPTGVRISSSCMLSNSCTLAAMRATASFAACLVVFLGSGGGPAGAAAGLARGGIVSVEEKRQRGKNAF